MSTEESERKVWVFFYDAYMSLDILEEQGIVPESIDIARLSGYDIVIETQATVVACFEKNVFGVLTTVTHTELKRLYDSPYFPEAVVVQLLDGSLQPALCYMAHKTKAMPANNTVVDTLVQAAKKYGFSPSYIKQLESYRCPTS